MDTISNPRTSGSKISKISSGRGFRLQGMTKNLQDGNKEEVFLKKINHESEYEYETSVNKVGFIVEGSIIVTLKDTREQLERIQITYKT